MRENKITMQKFKSKTKIIEVFYLHKVIISIEHINWVLPKVKTYVYMHVAETKLDKVSENVRG